MKGSCIVMTVNGFMTEQAWLEMAPSMIAGIRAMPVIVDNPDWWVLLILDGFGAHFMNLEVYIPDDPCLYVAFNLTLHLLRTGDGDVPERKDTSRQGRGGFISCEPELRSGIYLAALPLPRLIINGSHIRRSSLRTPNAICRKLRGRTRPTCVVV